MAKISTPRKTQITEERMALCLFLVSQGLGVLEALADPRIGVSYSAYRQWRSRTPRWAAEIDVARKVADETKGSPTDLTSAQFALKYFGRVRAPFQQLWINEAETMRPGNILLALWPPEHGKTTTFEDYATEKICRNPEWRNTTASESDAISKRILQRVRNRLEPDGPFPGLVRDWGPFRPDAGRSSASSGFHQPWNNSHFNVFKKRASDERDHNMLAISWNSSTVSIRTDHLHIDDLQSTKTLGATARMLSWFRQDGLSRPGETGITTINMTRVGDDDFPSHLENDDELEGICKVIKLRAIVKNQLTGEDEPLWPQKFTLEGLDRIRRKVKDEAFDRNYMMSPGASQKKRTFTDEGKAKALMPLRRLNEYTGFEGRPTVVLSLDPGLDPGKCTLNGWVMTATTMELVYFAEDATLRRNEEIIDMIATACRALKPHFKVAHLVVEAMNFQRGLARDERLAQLKTQEGFTMGEHLTNINKYDENIGVASMAGDWEAGKILLPYGSDPFTRTETDELCRQLKAWKPLARGSKLRQDRVMTMWFAWIWWQAKRDSLDAKPTVWKRQGLPWQPNTPKHQLIIPIGVRF